MRIFKVPTGNIFAVIGFYSLPFLQHTLLLRHLQVSESPESRAPKENRVDFSQGLSCIVLVRTTMLPCFETVLDMKHPTADLSPKPLSKNKE